MQLAPPVILGFMLGLALPANAQEQITPDAFLDAAVNNTLTFEMYPEGGIVGVEEFLSRTRTVWSTPEGTCTYGRLEVRETQICFIYDDLPVPEHCWVPYTTDDGMIVVSVSGVTQRVSRITRYPVICEDEAIS